MNRVKITSPRDMPDIGPYYKLVDDVIWRAAEHLDNTIRRVMAGNQDEDTDRVKEVSVTVGRVSVSTRGTLVNISISGIGSYTEYKAVTAAVSFHVPWHDLGVIRDMVQALLQAAEEVRK